MTAATSDNPPSAARVPHRCRPVLAGARCIVVDSAGYGGAGRISLRRSRAVNEDGAEVVDVGEGRPGGEKIAEPREKRGGVVLGEKGGRIEAGRAGGALKGGLHLKARNGTPLANVMLGVLQALGLEDMERFGDSDGTFELNAV